jgi:hypothetical protein
MPWARFAIIDVRVESQSYGKALLLFDDGNVALEVAAELQERGLDVAIRKNEPVTRSPLTPNHRGQREATITRLRRPAVTGNRRAD